MAGMLVRAALLGVAALAVAGCSAGPDKGGESASPAARSVQTAPKVLPLGSVGKLTDRDGGTIATVEISHVTAKAHLKVGAPPEGKQIATVTAKACNGALSQPGNLDWGPFALYLGDDTVAEAVTSWNDQWFSKPMFPQYRTVQPGDCVKGLVPFAIPKDAKIVRVEYQAPGGDTLLWSAAG